MKKIIFIALLTAGSASFAFSQTAATTGNKQQTEKPAKTPEERATEVTNRLTKELALTADQATKVHALALTRANEMDALKAKGSTDKAANDAERKKYQDEFAAGMKTILTPDQYTKWEAQKEAHKQEHKGDKAAPTSTGK